ncbi:Wzz/FepE/Etk N-terminal domain-containing protein [Flavobacterium sp. SUN046]|uniref:Wzz/FepE/Etk N-terminal domain-containing protein n=1 Tax=Flavobacterium sp. SUN046 TaxID=3002440 RepID=UPI002DB8CCBA|nr:Wzz/FepE/Etk N-terminal domain-containing protein [Flavobacterium sp. SUN046]MEC4049266.1 Wzz/FepE/Etk N-terminal domain-containing protein [Flavobacterium sp. SUN046]
MNENIRLLKPLFRGLPIVIIVVIISVLSAKKYLTYVTPIYESTAKLRLADVHEGVPGANLFKDLDVFASTNKIATEIEVLKSTSLIEKTLSELPFSLEIYRKGAYRTQELFGNSPIHVEGTFKSDKLYDKRISLNVISNNKYIISLPDEKVGKKGTFGKPITLKDGKFLITLNNDYILSRKEVKIVDKYEFEFLSHQKLMDKIDKDLDIVPVDKDVPVIRINLKSNVPEKAAMFVNKLAEMYIKDYIESKYKVANITVDFLKDEIKTANDKLTNSEENIQNYRDDRNIINVRQETETDLRKISQLKIQQTNIRMNLDAIKVLNKYISESKGNYLNLATNFEAFTDLLSTEMIKNIKKLQADKKDLLLTYTPEDDKVKVIDAKLKDLIDYQVESIKNTQKNLQVKYDDLSKDIEESEKVFIGLPEKEKMLTILDREFNIYQKNYNFLNEKRIEAEIAKSAKIAFHKIIAPGEVPKTPISPISGIIIIVAAFLGMLGSIIIIYIVHFAKAKVNDAFTIEKNSSIPIAFETPFIKNKLEIDNIFLKEAIQMELKGMIHKQSIIVLSSFDKSSQHLFHSRNLIKAFLAQGRKVLVVDATGQLEGVFNTDDYLNYSPSRFLSYTKAIFEKEIYEKMKDYDLCFVHNQSIKDDKLALLFMSLGSQNLMLLDSRETSEKSILKIELLKDEFHINNLWFVLNKAGYNPNVFVEVKKFIERYLKNK